jgi:hypothetical protein
MKQTRRLQALEERAAQRNAWRQATEGVTERLHARLDAIGQRLRVAGAAIEFDPDDFACRMAVVKADIQWSRAQYDAWCS